MNGKKAKWLRDGVNGNPLAGDRSYRTFGGTVVCVGARRAYRFLKKKYRGG